MIDVCWGKRKRGGKSVLQCSCITIDWPSVLLTQPLNRWIKLSFTQHSSILSSSQYFSPFSSCHFLLFISSLLSVLLSSTPSLICFYPLPSPFFHLFCLFCPLPSFFSPLNSLSCLLSFCHCSSLLLSFSSPVFICHKYSNHILWKQFHIWSLIVSPN